MKRLIKSKLSWIAAAYVCIFVVALVFAINTEPESAPCECTLEDINNNEKFGAGVYSDAVDKNISDQMALILYFDRELSHNEILQIEELGLDIDDDSWLPAPAVGGSYTTKCKVENICKLACSNLVKRVVSGETEAYPQ